MSLFRLNTIIRERSLFPKDMASVIQTIDNQYDYNTLKRFCNKHIKPLLTNKLVEKTIDNNEIYTTYFESPDTRKYTLAVQLTFFLFYDKLSKLLFQHLPEETLRVLNKVVWYGDITAKEINKTLKINVLDENSRNIQLKSEFSIVSFEYNYRNPELSLLLLPNEVAGLLKKIIKKPDFKIEPIDKISDDFIVYENKDQIFSELPMITKWYSLEGNVQTGSGRIKASAQNKLQKKTNLKEFFETNKKELKNLRSYLIICLLSESVINYDKEPLVVLKELFASYKTNFKSLYHLYPELKGNTRIYSYNNVEKDLFKILKLLDIDKWYSFESIMNIIKITNIKTELLSKELAKRFIYFQDDDDFYKYKVFVEKAMYRDLIEIPLIKNTIALFAAFGLVDIAYKDINVEKFPDTYTCVFQNIEYVRLTPLGEYIADKKKNYTPAKQKELSFHLSNKRLIIRIEGDNKKAEIILKDIARSIGNNRYIIDSKSFLKTCQRKADLENLIVYFKQSVTKKLPENWNEFFSYLLNNSFAMVQQTDKEVYQLPENKELLKIIGNDPKIKKIVERAEGFQIVIEKRKKNQLKNILKEYGYIID